MSMLPSPAATTWRRKRPRVVVLLTTALCCLPSVAGFGFSGVGAVSPARKAVADAALVRAGRSGERAAEWRKRSSRAHEITCKVSSPRRYGSAVSACCVCLCACAVRCAKQPPLLSPLSTVLMLDRDFAGGETHEHTTAAAAAAGLFSSLLAVVIYAIFGARRLGERDCATAVPCACFSLCSCFCHGLPGEKPTLPSPVLRADRYILAKFVRELEHLRTLVCCVFRQFLKHLARQWGRT